MLRIGGRICTAAAIPLVASGCTWQQAYYVGQAWQRSSCTRFVEQTERDRCLGNANMSYEDYRRQVDAPKRD